MTLDFNIVTLFGVVACVVEMRFFCCCDSVTCVVVM